MTVEPFIVIRTYWQELFPLFTVIVGILGACVGSFLNVVIWRLPRGESLVHPPSRCPACGHAIRPWENIPIVSWLVLRGRCSGCRQPISTLYPAIEALTAVLFLAVWFRNELRGGSPGFLLTGFFLAGSMVAVAMIDARHRRVPDLITYTGMAVGILAAFIVRGSHPLAISEAVHPERGLFILEAMVPAGARLAISTRLAPGLDAVLGCLAGLGGFIAVRVAAGLILKRQDALGWGDVKLIGMVGALLGLEALPFVVAISCGLACLCGAAGSLLRRQSGLTSVPFGPYVAVGTLFWILFGADLLTWLWFLSTPMTPIQIGDPF